MYSNKINQFLKNFLLEKQQNWPIYSLNKFITDYLVVLSQQGKKFRANLFINFYQSLATDFDQKLAIQVGAALELVHLGLLIQDDVMDSDLKRRGEDSFHVYLNKQLKSSSNPKKTAESIATCAGDLCFFLSLELMPVELKQVFCQEISLVCLAQAEDVFLASLNNKTITKETIINMFQGKTGRYTWALPLILASILTNQDEKTVSKLTELGEKLGIIFQIKDDKLGLFGSSEAIGKEAGSDVKQNKKTLYWFYAQQKLSAENLAYFQQFYGKKDLTQLELERVKQLVTDSKIDQQIEKLVSQYNNKISEELKKLRINQKAKTILNQYIAKNLSRLT